MTPSDTPKLLAFYGSPRRNGNTTTLLNEAVAGARQAGARVREYTLRDLKLSPCLEIYGCKQNGRCIINDDFQQIYDDIQTCDGIMLASPIFFYTVSAHTKILMDRCQSFWVKKNWVTSTPPNTLRPPRPGLFISVGATRGNKLFEGALLTVRYFFEAIDTRLWQSLLYKGLDSEKDIRQHPAYRKEAHTTGGAMVEHLRSGGV